MSVRCDHCRQNLDPIVHIFCRMKFCSVACKDAYQDRLGEETKAKICRLQKDVANDAARVSPMAFTPHDSLRTHQRPSGGRG